MADNEHDIPVENSDLVDGDDNPMDRFFFHQKRALEETGKALEALLPPDFRNHAGEASKEFAQGFRILVDVAIDELKKVSEREDEEAQAAQGEVVDDDSNDDDDEPPTTTGKTKVKVSLD